jgi:hypothetical protein
MKRALVLLLLLGHAMLALADQDDAPKTKWVVELTEGDDVPADGQHIGLHWTRDYDPTGAVVIFRRAVPAGTQGKGGPIRVVDQKAQVIPAFMYPDTFKDQYYPAIDTSQKPIPRGTKLGVWTVAGSVDGDPSVWVDHVEPGSLYIYTLVPAVRGAAPDTYESMEGSAVVTPPLAPKPASLIHRRWFQIVVLAALGVLVAASFALRRRRAGAKPPAEAS